MPTGQTEALGIHQSDVILRSAIMLAIADMRANPYLLDYAFASLPRDALTSKEYGAQELARAKEWFRKTDIQVFLNVNPNSVKFPCVSIALLASVEDDSTLGDVHYVPVEDNDYAQPELAGPLAVTAYDPATGAISFTPESLNGLVMAPTMLLYDVAGNSYPIVEVGDDGVSAAVAPGVVADFGGGSVRPARPAFATEVESVVYRESYSLGCHVDGEPVHLTYLHSIVVFALLRYKETLLEARSFERSTLSSSDFKREEEQLPEFYYSRYVQVTGYVRQAWPKVTAPKATAVEVDVVASRVDVDPDPQAVDVFDSSSSSSAASSTSSASSLVTAYYGTAAQPGSLNGAFVIGLGASFRTDRRQATLRFDAPAGEYCWYATPVDLGGAPSDFIDEETLEVVGVSNLGVVLVAGVYCNVWRTNQAALGALTVIVT